MKLTPEQQAKLDELQVQAKALGAKVKTHWLDDWQENALIAAIFAAIGFMVGKFW